MFAPTFRRSLLEARGALPPTFLLPFRARITTVSHNLEPGNVPEPLVQSGQHTSKDQEKKSRTPKNTASPSSPQPSTPSQPAKYLTADAQSQDVSPITPSIRKLLPLLQSQAPHYMTLHIHGKPYLLTHGDTLRLPFLMPNVQPGDVLRLNRATHIGSRDYTLKAPEPIRGSSDAPKKIKYLDDRLFVCRATVVGVESEPMRFIEKTKRRQRHVRTVKSKHRYTILRVSEMNVKGLEEYEMAIKEEEN